MQNDPASLAKPLSGNFAGCHRLKVLGNLRIVEFGGANAGEHIREAHLWDEAAKLWIPWIEGADICAGPKTAWEVTLARVLDVHAPMMRGPDVRTWQAFLVKQGLELDVDGIFGPKTSAKTQTFQRAYDLPESGALDAVTFHAAVLAGYVQPPSVPADVSLTLGDGTTLDVKEYDIAPPSTLPDGATPVPSFVDAVIARAELSSGGSYTDRATFTLDGTVRGAERQEVAIGTTLDRWARVTTSGSSGTALGFCIMWGVRYNL